MDDMLLSERSFKKLDPVIDKVLSICRRKNMKLNPKKFKVGTSVEFRGTNVKYSPANDIVQITPSEDKVEELLGRNPPKSRKDLPSVLGSLNQLSQWCPSVKVKIPLKRKMCGNNNIFKTSPQLEEEFNTMKNYVKKTVTLSPLEMGKEIHLHTDASNLGLGYILSQPHKNSEDDNQDHYHRKRNIITLGSAGLTSTQERYSVGEQEALSVLHAVQKTDFYLRGAKKILVHTDNKNLVDYF